MFEWNVESMFSFLFDDHLIDELVADLWTGGVKSFAVHSLAK